MDTEEDRDAVKAVSDGAVCLLDQDGEGLAWVKAGHMDKEVDAITKYVIEELLGSVSVQHEELRDEEELPAGIVHQRVLH